MADPLTEAADARQAMVDAFRRLSTLARIVVVGFGVTIVLLVAVLGGIVGITLDTNRAVERQVVPLQERNTELEGTVAQLEDVNRQAVDWVVKLSELLRQNGVTPPEVVIRPTTTTTTPE